MQYSLTEPLSSSSLKQDDPSSDHPVSAEEFSDLLKQYSFKAQVDRLAVAVSGGPDSMALAICLQRWAVSQKNHPLVMAFIVDHRLRPESSHEAQATKAHLEAHNIKAEILVWQHEPIISRIHTTARKARYQLLEEASRQHNMRYLFFAHQSEDQAETILMRLAKGSGVDGLAGIPPHSCHDDVHILRPFLSTSKSRLIATCRAADVPFVTDLSNTSEKYARGRLRKIMPVLEQEGFTVERLNDLGVRAAEAKEALDYFSYQFLEQATSRDEAGVIHIDLHKFCTLPISIAERVMTSALHAIHPQDYAPERQSLRGLLDGLRTSQIVSPRTLQGALISKTASQIVVMREISSVSDSLDIKAGESRVWDERWRVSLIRAPSDGRFYVRCLGNPPHEVVDNLSPKLRHKIPQGRYRAGLPALWSDQRLIMIPSLSSVDNSSFMTAELLKSWPCSRDHRVI